MGSLCPTQQRSNFEGLEAVGGTGPGAPCSDNRGGSQTRRCTGTRFALGVGSFPLRYRLSEPRKSRKKKKKAVLAHHQHFKPGLSTVGARPPAVLQPNFRPDCPDRAASPGSPGPTCRSFLASLAPLVQATVRSELPALPSLAGPSTRGEQSWGTHPLSTVTWRQASPHTWLGLCSSISRTLCRDAKKSATWNWPDLRCFSGLMSLNGYFSTRVWAGPCPLTARSWVVQLH